MSGMRQDFGYDLRGLTASGSTQPIQDVFHYVGASVSVTLPPQSEPGKHCRGTGLDHGRATAGVGHPHDSPRSRRRSRHDAAQRALEITGHVREVAVEPRGRPPDLYAGTRHLAGRDYAEQRRYIDVETGYTDVLKQVYDAAVDIERRGHAGALKRGGTRRYGVT